MRSVDPDRLGDDGFLEPPRQVGAGDIDLRRRFRRRSRPATWLWSRDLAAGRSRQEALAGRTRQTARSAPGFPTDVGLGLYPDPVRLLEPSEFIVWGGMTRITVLGSSPTKRPVPGITASAPNRDHQTPPSTPRPSLHPSPRRPRPLALPDRRTHSPAWGSHRHRHRPRNCIRTPREASGGAAPGEDQVKPW